MSFLSQMMRVLEAYFERRIEWDVWREVLAL